MTLGSPPWQSLVDLLRLGLSLFERCSLMFMFQVHETRHWNCSLKIPMFKQAKRNHFRSSVMNVQVGAGYLVKHNNHEWMDVACIWFCLSLKHNDGGLWPSTSLNGRTWPLVLWSSLARAEIAATGNCEEHLEREYDGENEMKFSVSTGTCPWPITEETARMPVEDVKHVSTW